MEKEVIKKLDKFLKMNIGAVDLAKRLRRFKVETIKMILEMESTDAVRMDWISDGYYFITELCEILDPQLEDEE
ncbi:hypothetical protein PG614_10450 [Riemerella anatipestifer]|nr:hypothetical protein [Riemerella anatipestifer]MDY3534315.1 hypothetical protein [Riemerella anatipestifer]MDY3536362.1 hypothetical protein [Riemerella anatipestifer]